MTILERDAPFATTILKKWNKTKAMSYLCTLGVISNYQQSLIEKAIASRGQHVLEALKIHHFGHPLVR